MMLLGFPDYRQQGEALAKAAGLEYREIQLHRFPDGESRLRLPEQLPPEVVICRSLDRPNDKLPELLLAAAGARELGAECLTLVAPYLCYMRQDKAFQPGEVVSQRHLGQLLSRYFDRLVTVDAHLHRVKSLQQVFPGRDAINLSPTREIAQFISELPRKPLLLGPDSESRQWVEGIAKATGCDWVVASKLRVGDRSVQITLPERNYQGECVLLLDDVVSSGQTLAKAAAGLAGQGAGELSLLVTHALYSEGAEQSLRRAGIRHLWSCDSISHPSNRIGLARLLASAIRA